MGKIVKFCNSCDEGFAEKFGFCPNCGQTLQKFEMNPVVTETAQAEPEIVAAPAVEPVAARVVESEVVTTPHVDPVDPEFEAVEAASPGLEPDLAYETAQFDSPEIDTMHIDEDELIEDEPIARVEPLPVVESTAP